MDGFQICKEISGLHESILGAEISQKGSTVAAHSKSGALPRIERLIVQTELYLSILEASEGQLGRPHYLMAHCDNIDLLFFPIMVNGRKMILAIRAAAPYGHEELVGKVREYVGKVRLASR